MAKDESVIVTKVQSPDGTTTTTTTTTRSEKQSDGSTTFFIKVHIVKDPPCINNNKDNNSNNKTGGGGGEGGGVISSPKPKPKPKPKTPPPEFELTVNNLPSKITKDNVQKKFPNAKRVDLNKNDGTAQIVYESEDDRDDAWDDSDLVKLDKPKLAWLRPEELYVENVPKNVTEEDLKEEFPTAKNIDVKNVGGKKIATVDFGDEAERKKAEAGIGMKKLAPQRFQYKKGGGAGDGLKGPKNAQVQIENLPDGISEDEIKKKIPGVTGVKIDKGGRKGTVQFKNVGDAKSAVDDTKMIKLSKNKLAWLNPEELAVQGLPDGKVDAELKKQFPTAKSTKFFKDDDGNRIAIENFGNEGARKKAEDASDYEKLAPQKLKYKKGDSDGLKGPKNAQVQIENLPDGISEDEVKKQFPGATGVKIDKGNGKGTIQFKNVGDAKSAVDDTKMIKLSKNKLAWLNPEELAVQGLPDGAVDAELKKQFPTAKSTKFLKDDDGNRIAIENFGNEGARKKAEDASDYEKLAPQKLKYKKGDGDGLKGPKNAQVQIENIPAGTSEEEIKKKFPGATGVKIEKGNGKGIVQFKNAGDAKSATEDTDMIKLGKSKLAWLRPEELAVQGLPDGAVDDELKKQFPTSKSTKFLKDGDGNRIAITNFGNEGARKKAEDASDYEKVAPQKLKFKKGDGVTSNKNAQLTLTNLSANTDEEDIKKKFSTAVGVRINKGDGTAIVQFKTAGDAQSAYSDTDLIKLGSKKLGWLKGEELYIQNVPDSANEAELKKQFPTAKSIKFQKGEGGKRIATAIFPNEAVRKKAEEASSYEKIGPQMLNYSTAKGNAGVGGVKSVENIDGMTDGELARKLWQLPEQGYSNISNIFTPGLVVTGLPPNTNRTQILKFFPDAKKVDIQKTKKGQSATVEFDDAKKAAHAYGVSRQIEMDGHKLTVRPIKVGRKK